MKIIVTEEFSKKLAKLPLSTKRVYKKQESLFSINPRDPRLHLEKLKGSSTFSFRVTRKYRVLLEFTEESLALFVSIGHRKDVYKK